MPYIKQQQLPDLSSFNFQAKEESVPSQVILRVDFNIAYDFDKNQVIDDTRIQKALPTIHYLLEQNLQIILLCHFGRPKNQNDNKYSTKILADILQTYLLHSTVKFIASTDLKIIKEQVSTDKKHSVLFLENIRFFKEETSSDENIRMKFAKQLAELAQFYVNDAFGTCHREHASIKEIPKCLPSVGGFLLLEEFNVLSKFLYEGRKPITFVLGGSKISTKLKLIENLMPKVDYILIGGAMVYTFLKSKAINIGDSIVEKEYLSSCLRLIFEKNYHNTEVLLPVDHVVVKNRSNIKSKKISKNSIPEGYIGVDIGPKTINLYKKIIKTSSTIFWNGPMGIFEIPSFSKGSFQIAKSIANTKNAFTAIGGGESLSVVKLLDLQEKFSYVSTGGGASLQFLEGSVMPGLKSLQ